NAGAPTGAALGTFVLGTFAAVLPADAFMAWGWRVPFLLSFVLLIVGMVVRSKISESPIFLAALAKEKQDQDKPKNKLPILQVLARPRPLFLTLLAGASVFALQVLLSPFSFSYAPEYGADRSAFLYAFPIASVASVSFVVFFAKIPTNLD